MTSFGRDAPHQSVHYNGNNRSLHVYTVPSSRPNNGGEVNRGYYPSHVDDERSSNTRPSRNGFDNRGYIPSVYGHLDNNGVPPPNNNYHNTATKAPSNTARKPSSFDQIDGQKDTKQTSCSRRRLLYCSIVGVLALIISGVIIFLVLFFATDIIRKRDTPDATTTAIASTSTTPTPIVTMNDSTAISNITQTTMSMLMTTSSILHETTTAVPETSTDTFSGKVTLNEAWKAEYDDPTSEEFRNISQQFIQLMDQQLSADADLGSTYNSTSVVNLMTGSVVVIFYIKFNQPTVVSVITDRVQVAISTPTPSFTLAIVSASLVITDFEEATACGTDSKLLCDDRCQKKDLIACNGQVDCSDWYDEHDCPGESVTCDFESSDTCGYLIQSKGDHQYNWIYNSGPTPTANTGPEYDHTYMNSSGHYYYTEWCSTCGHGDIAVMASPIYVTRQPACLSFYYHMKGNEMGPLYLYSEDNFDNTVVLWTRDKPDVLNQKGDWQQVKVNVPAGSYRFYFASFFERSLAELVDKAIDDIEITSGSCTNTLECDSRSFFCPSLYKCIESHRICDGRFDCPDGSDEETCSGNYQVRCSFEGESFSDCNLLQDPTDENSYQWRIVYASTRVDTQGTDYDYTYKNEIGHYATALPGQFSSGSQAKLKSINLSASFVRCLQFAYNMNDESKSHTDELLVYINKASGVNSLLWNQTGPAGRDWNFVNFTLPPQNEDYTIEFVAVRGVEGLIISLDDVTIKDGFCPCTESGRSHCVDYECIPNEWLCDGDSDCSNGEDERNCASCPDGQYQCGDRSCVNGGSSVICDMNYDCADGSDEDGCATLDTCGSGDCITLKYTDDNYYEVCSQGWDASLDSQICKYLYRSDVGSSSQSTAASSAGKYLQLTNPSANGFISRFTVANSCPEQSVIKVNCLDDVCGRRDPSVSPFIIGGFDSDIQGRWPWQVELSYFDSPICGGTILNDHWIVTAAHCVDEGREAEPEFLSVLAGSTTLKPEESGSAKFGVSRVVLHPQFRNIRGGYDIALLFIDNPIPFSTYIKPACLPNPADIYNSRSHCYLTGWGVYQLEPQSSPNRLQEAKFKLMDKEVCNDTLAWNGTIIDKMICGGYSSGTIRSCTGDSGGPLVCKDKYQKWNLVGITSFGPGKCLLENLKPDVFTQVSSFQDWISNIIDFEFICDNKKKIADSILLCNGEDDCGDRSDETRQCVASISCNFELKNLCGYTVSGGWTRITGAASSNGLLENTGPSFDHTKGVIGERNAYMVASVNDDLLTSPEHDGSSEQCLELYYYISSSSNSMKIYKDNTNGELLGTLPGGSKLWRRFQVTLPAGKYALTFQAVVVELSYVAIDDINLTSGSCQPSCTNGLFACSDNSACIETIYKCDGIANCLDGSDEVGCGDVTLPSCSFDKPFFCGFQQEDTDDFNAIFQYGPRSGDFSTGPPAGHSDNVDEIDNAYLLFAAPNSYGRSALTWPLKLPRAGCMSFYYYMHGKNVGTLSISTNGKTLWQMFGDKGQQWYRAYVTLEPGQSVEISSQSSKKLANNVAIDDIEVSEGQCVTPTCPASEPVTCGTTCLPATTRCDKTVDCFDLSDELPSCGWSVDCEFESECNGYSITGRRADSFTWTYSEGHLKVTSLTASLGSETAFTSSPFRLEDKRCLTFKYKINGNKDLNPELRVTLVEPTIRRETILWRYASNQQEWSSARVPLDPSSQSAVQLVFQAFYGGNRTYSVHLDSISTTAGSCSFKECPGQFLCTYDETCIPLSKECDGVSDCQGSTDEHNCGDLGKLIDCDFEDGLCNWRDVFQNNKLLRASGQTPLPNTGPEYDHSWKNYIGYYVYINTSIPGDQVKLVSPTIRTSQASCLTFYYHMLGGDIGFLNVTNDNSSQSQPLLSLNTAQSDAWHRARVTLPAADATTLVFTLTSRGVGSNLAIDDVTLRDGECDCSDGFQCTKGNECFEDAMKCDFNVQCLDESDEAAAHNCGCPPGGLRCGDVCYLITDICKQPLLITNCYDTITPFNCTCDALRPFQCPLGFCISNGQYCNGENDCYDDADEAPKCADKCPDQHRACTNKELCYPDEFYCDGQADCGDRSDEPPGCVPIVTPTEPTGCASSNFMCQSNDQVIARSKYCDGQVNCLDASDEPGQCDCCPDTEYKCSSGFMCISIDKHCNGVYDCVDSTDEYNCSCTQEQFTCDMGLCLSQAKRCDGVIDCIDMTDETFCNCSEREFRCKNGRCIDKKLACNNRDDCLDNSDEHNCPCLTDQIKCTDNSCIPLEWNCDGFNDCKEGEDESDCGTCQELTCTNRQCVAYSSVCNQVGECTDHSDEQKCYSVLNDTSVIVKLNPNGTNGVASDYFICFDDWDSSSAASVCSKLGGGSPVFSSFLSDKPGPWLKLLSSSPYLQPVPTCSSNRAVGLQCAPLQCGESSKLAIAPFVVSGNLVKSRSDWPWVVALYYSGKFTGAGVYLGNGWVITAGHVVRVLRNDNGYRYIEKRDLAPHLFHVEPTSLTRTGSLFLNVSRIVLHADFKTLPSLHHDIALFRLEKIPELPAICSNEQDKLSDLCYVVGWGSIDGTDNAVLKLRETRTDVLPDSECIPRWNSGGNTLFYPRSMVCSGGKDLPSTCFGDSGGPLMCLNTENGRWGLKGIVSFGESECYYHSRPNVYTKVSAYMPWIQNITSL